jgi:hypothetical protein
MKLKRPDISLTIYNSLLKDKCESCNSNDYHLRLYEYIEDNQIYYITLCDFCGMDSASRNRRINGFINKRSNKWFVTKDYDIRKA